jgi:hypothetical protein
MMSGSSNGCTKARPASAARARAASRHSSTLAPASRTVAPSAAAPSALAIGASAGMNTSHGTPRARAANASACAWLPAEPHTTPFAHALPRASSLARTPRSLNDPVRCRDSALRTTSAPVISDSVADGSTGVWRTRSAPAARARAMSSAVTVAAGTAMVVARSVRERDHRVDLDPRAERQGRTPIVDRAGGVSPKNPA